MAGDVRLGPRCPSSTGDRAFRDALRSVMVSSMETAGTEVRWQANQHLLFFKPTTEFFAANLSKKSAWPHLILALWACYKF